MLSWVLKDFGQARPTIARPTERANLPNKKIFKVFLLNLVHFDCGWLFLMTRRGDVIAFELRDQYGRLCTKARRNSAYLFVVIGILLFVNDGEVTADNVDSFARRIERHVVRHFRCWQSRND